jgi:hypothetical protein
VSHTTTRCDAVVATPAIALVMFLLLPLFYFVTSEVFPVSTIDSSDGKIVCRTP